MKPGKNILYGLVALALAGVSAMAWHQYQELIVLRAQLADGDNATLKRQLADARKTIKSLQDRLAALRGRRGGADGDASADGADGEGGANGANRRGGGRFGMLLPHWPETRISRSFSRIQMKGRIVQTYAAAVQGAQPEPGPARAVPVAPGGQAAGADGHPAGGPGAGASSPRSDPDGFKTLMNQAISQVGRRTSSRCSATRASSSTSSTSRRFPERNTVNSLQTAAQLHADAAHE